MTACLIVGGDVEASVAAAAPSVVTSESVFCHDVAFLGARGSGQPQDKVTNGKKKLWENGMGPEVNHMGGVVSHLAEASSLSVVLESVNYSADSVNDLQLNKAERQLIANGQTGAAAAYWAAHNLHKYDASIDNGVADVIADVEKSVSACPDQQLILAGYSQGAIAVHDAENWLKANDAHDYRQIRGTLLLGDGDRIAGSAAHLVGSASRSGQGVRPYAHIVKSRDVAAPASTVEICNEHDIVCDTSLWDIKHASEAARIHGHYPDALLDLAAHKMSGLLRQQPGHLVTRLNYPLASERLTNFADLVASGLSSYVLGTDGHVYSDDGGTRGRLTPLPGLSNITQLVAGSEAEYALASDGEVYAWSIFNDGNSKGQLGDGTTAASTTPVVVSGITSAVQIATSNNTGYALLSDGTVRAWGSSDGIGLLGDGKDYHEQYVTSPVQVINVEGATSIASGWQGTFALEQNGAVMEWGCDAAQSPDANSPTGLTLNYSPVQIAGLPPVVSVAANQSAGFALTSAGKVWSWGAGAAATDQSGTDTAWRQPAEITSLPAIASVATYEQNAVLALTPSGEVYQWSAESAQRRVSGIGPVAQVGGTNFGTGWLSS